MSDKRAQSGIVIRRRLTVAASLWMLALGMATGAGAQQPAPPPTAASQAAAEAKARKLHLERVAARKRAALLQAEKARQAALAAMPKPATVNLVDGRLTVIANNSDLAQILRQIAASSGMKVQGLGRSDRVFGAYGPGAPSDVLADLLTGTGYNFLLSGRTAQGTPGEVLLSARGAGATSSAQLASLPGDAGTAPGGLNAPPPLGAAGDAALTNAGANGNPANGNISPTGEQLGEGAVSSVPPNQSDQANDPSNDGARQQQNMQRLQQMYAAQEQQNPH